MGANFCSMALDGNLTAEEVRAAFKRAQEEDRYHNGHSYSGGFGQASGLEFKTHRVFPDARAAEVYLDTYCEKWEDALVVKYVADEGLRYMIGAWCAS
jgi:hypothetical protein